MNFIHPAFDPYRDLIATLDLAHGLPTLSALNTLATARTLVQAQGRPVRFVAPGGRLAARDYETHILATGEVPTRADTWHDALNALVWLRYPAFKAALNHAHVLAMGDETGPERSRRRDALTVLDESGVWIVGRDRSLYEGIVAHAWQTVFWQQRQAVQAGLRFVVVGHALLEKALERGVLFTPGSHFLAEGGESQAIRLNFSLAGEAEAERGLAIIGELLRNA